MSRRGPAAAMLAVAILAFLARAAYLYEAESVPLHHVLISDGRAYSEWAQEIAAGDLMGRTRGVFYQAPLYPYLLALVYRVGGESLLAIRIVQMVLGIAGAMLMVVAGRSFFSLRAGLAAGVLLALYPPAIFFDGMIQKTSLAVFLLTALLATMGLLYRKATRLRWVVLGLLLGFLVLTRENALLLLPVLMLWSCTHPAQSGRQRAAVQLGCFLAGVSLVLLPVASRSLSVGGVFALTTAQAGPNLYIGNHPGASGTYEPLRRGRSDTPFERRDAIDLAEAAEGRPLDSGAVSRYWTGQAVAFLRAEPLSWLRLMGRKTGMALHRYELPDAHDLELYAESSRTLRWLGPGRGSGAPGTSAGSDRTPTARAGPSEGTTPAGAAGVPLGPAA